MYRVLPWQRLVLASASPRRREMLGRMGLEFTVRPAPADETLLPEETVDQAAMRLAELKARWAVEQEPGWTVLAADTLVAVDHQILGKPADMDQARNMLQALSGREHRVLTGFCLYHKGSYQSGLASTRVRFRNLAQAEIEAYLASGEPMDKAGAYAVQGLGAALVEEVSGSYTNVVGLPLSACIKLMLKHGVIEPVGGEPS